MLPIAHASVGFLISQIKIKGKTLSIKEVLFIIFCANLPDFDLFYIYLGGQKIYHHLLPSHTPIFAVGVVVMFYLIFKRQRRIMPLALLAILSHLALDDFSYWLKLIGLTSIGKPEIFWLFPFDPRRSQALMEYGRLRPSISGFLVSYIKHPVFIFEWVFLLWAGIVFVKNYGFLIKKLFFQTSAVTKAKIL